MLNVYTLAKTSYMMPWDESALVLYICITDFLPCICYCFVNLQDWKKKKTL